MHRTRQDSATRLRRRLHSAPGLALVVAVLGITTLSAPAAAGAQQSGELTARTANTPTIPAARVSAAPVIDGHMDEAVWAEAESVTAFFQIEPIEGAAVSQPTEVRIVHDHQALYVAARMTDVEGVSSRLGRRDTDFADSDWFSISLDSYHDRRTAYRFRVNPSGVRYDEVLSGGNERGGDRSWDPVWDVATAVSDSGWTVEMRIPFHQLRFRPAPVQTWGIQLERQIARNQERAVFAFTPRSERGGIARFGLLTGLRDVRPGGRWEVVPYAVARAQYAPAEENNPFSTGSGYGAQLGMDLTYRVTANLTLNATLNPDFGQVEADPAEVNLSAFETRLSERRPFFVEGSEIFRFGGQGAQFFYSRRIGRAPQVARIPEAEFAEFGDAATILAAAKLTGKTRNGWSVGVVDALTGRETARYVDAAGETRRAEVEPRANHLVARARREMRQGQTTAGGMLTAVNRDLSDPRARAVLPGAALMAGTDFTHQWDERSWFLQAWTAGTYIRGSREALRSVQRLSSRYFQRPDATHLAVDSAATRMAGYIAGLEIGKQAGEHWSGEAGLLATSPGFEVNDLGFNRVVDRLQTYGEIEYRQRIPGPVLRSWQIDLEPRAEWNFAGDFLGATASAGGYVELLSYWSARAGWGRSFSGLDDRLTRGGPLSRTLDAHEVFASVDSDPRRPVTGSLNGRYGWDERGGRSRSVTAALRVRPAPSWSFTLSPRLSTSLAMAQYLTSVPDEHATATYGRRYLFAELERATASLQTRLNVIFSPELSLEVYAEPFLASGAYGEPQQLERPRAFAFQRFGHDVGTLARTERGDYRVDPDGEGPAAAFVVRNEDFRRGSIRGNSVLRWEWRRGSTLYLVWQQERASHEPIGRFQLQQGLDDLWREPAANVLMLKVSYWTNR